MDRKKTLPNAKLMDRDIAINEMARTIDQAQTSGELAKRDSIVERFDLLDPDFLRFMALIGGYGARKYGEKNWQKSRLTGDKSPINHIMKHLVAYQNNESYDHPEICNEQYVHLAAIAFNAMMAFYHDYRGTGYEDVE